MGGSQQVRLSRLAIGSVWRWLLVATVLCLAAAPALPLAVSMGGQAAAGPVWTTAFSQAVRSSLCTAGGVTVLALMVGLPLGLVARLYRFPFSASLVLFQALPLL